MKLLVFGCGWSALWLECLQTYDLSGTSQDGRAFCQRFFRWYNHQHRHSGLGFHTPAAVHFSHAEGIQAERVRVLQAAYVAHPERFVRQVPLPPALPGPAWINKPTEVPITQ